MKAPVACPNCESSFSVSRANEGKRAKCPKCEQPFVISFASPEETEPAFPEFAAESPPPVPPTIARPAESQPQIQTVVESKDDSRRELATKRSVTLPQWAVIAIPALITLVLGYFIGREHLKYQMKSALTDVADAFSKGFAGEAGDSVASSSFAAAEPAAEPLPQLMIGKTHQADGFAITLTNAKVSISKVKDMMGEIGTGKNPDLALSFAFVNTDDRRILRFREGNQFMAGNFRLRDDVDNVIRGINYGIASKPVGALTGSEDIAPGATANHLELFSVPPPKTEYLILTISLACLGGDGEIEYKIPASAIAQ